MAFDIIIRNGTIVDGSGSPGYRSDLAIKDGKIAEIGRITDSANEVIDAEGLVVAPGIIDAHTHMDAQVCWEPLGTSSCWHGVTSVVMGNCGFTLAPCRPGESEALMKGLEAVEAIPADAMKAGIDWRWETYRQYLENLERLPKGINYGGYIGHSALRSYVMGERAFTDESTPEEIEAMCREVGDALDAGALGFSTSRTVVHLTPDGRHVPSFIANWDEVQALAGVLSKQKRGIMEIARRQSKQGLEQVRDLAIESRVPITYGCMPLTNITEPGGEWEEWVKVSDDVAERGGKIILQAHTRTLSSVWCFKSQLPWDRFPVWCDFRKLPLDAQEAGLRDPEMRRKLVEATRMEPNSEPFVTEARIKGDEEYEWITVFRSPAGPNPSIAEVARQTGKTPVEVVIDLSVEHGLGQMFWQPLSKPNDQGLLDIMKHPSSVVTFSDSGAHVSQISDSSLQTHLLSYWVRERQALTLEQAVRKITSDIASGWDLHDRGLLRQGLAGDVMIFDPEKIAPAVPEVTHDLPTGALRLTQKAVGMHHTIVNGQTLLRDGKHTGALPGQVLKSSPRG